MTPLRVLQEAGAAVALLAGLALFVAVFGVLIPVASVVTPLLGLWYILSGRLD